MKLFNSCIILFVFALVSLNAFDGKNISDNCKFIENKGQYPPNILFYSKAKGYEVYLTNSGLIYNLNKIENGKRTGQVVSMNFVNSKSNEFELSKGNSTGAKRSYFIGNDPNKWVTDVNEFEVAYLKNTWNGIDIKFYFENNNLRYDFEVNKGANPQDIKVQFLGAESFALENNNGNEVINLKTKFGNITHSDLKSFTYGNDKSDNFQAVNSKFIISNNNVLSFDVNNYDNSKKLVIDPVILTTILSGEADDDASYITNLGDSAFIVTGWTNSSDFLTTPGAYQTAFNAQTDSYIHKYDIKVGSYVLAYGTYFGGSGEDKTIGIKLDVSGNIYVGGNTNSTDFPIVKGFGTTYKGQRDVFVTKFKPNFSAIEYSGLITGTNDDFATSMDVKGTNAYICGQTKSTDLSIKNSYQNTNKNSGDGFYAKINDTGTSFDFCSYFGGSDEDYFSFITVDASGALMLAGSTKSSNLPASPNSGGMTPDRSYDVTYNGGWDAFYVKVNTNGNTLVFCTFYGGTDDDFGVGFFSGADGVPFVVGYSKKEPTNITFPTTDNVYQKANKGGYDIFLGKISNLVLTDLGGPGNPKAYRQSLLFNTFIGGKSDDIATAAMINPKTKGISIVGKTISSDFPVINMDSKKINGGNDAFYIEVNNFGNALANSSFFGGGGDDVFNSLAIDDNGDLFFAGTTTSGNFIGSSGTFTGTTTQNGFISKYSFGSLLVSNPSNGGKYCKNSDVPLGWTQQNLIGGLDVYYAKKNTTDFQLAVKGLTGTSSQWTIPTTIPTGDYYLKFVNRSGLSGLSGIFSVQGPPNFSNFSSTQQLTSNSSTFCEGGNFVLVANATDATGYVWKKDGQVIASATTATLTLNGLGTKDNGEYNVVVNGTCAPMATSPNYSVFVMPNVSVTKQPVNVEVNAGTDVNITFEYNGFPTKFTWKKDNQTLIGKTEKSLMFKSVLADNGIYRCILERDDNNCKSIDSTIDVTVKINPEGSVRDLYETKSYLVQSPTELNLYLNLDVESNAKVSLLNTNGQELGVYLNSKLYTNQKLTIDKSNLTSGVYFLMVQLNEEVFVDKVSIVK